MPRKWITTVTVLAVLAILASIALLPPVAGWRREKLDQWAIARARAIEAQGDFELPASRAAADLTDRDLERLSLKREARDEQDQAAIDRVRELAQNKFQEWDNTWFGVPVLQFPTDLLLYQTLVWEFKPDFVVETGTYQGGLSLFFASLLEHIGGEGKVITVDLDGENWRNTLASVPVAQRLAHRVVFLEGDSVKPKIYNTIVEMATGKQVLVVLDSWHAKEHVLAELRLYSKLVPAGGYVIVNDTHHDKTHWLSFQEGPLAAVHEFVKENPNFVIDRSRERYLISCVRSGILRRVQPDAIEQLATE